MKVFYISLYLHHPDEILLQMSIKEKKQILNYLFENDSIPAEVMNDFSLWLLENEDDSETESIASHSKNYLRCQLLLRFTKKTVQDVQLA